MSRSSATQAYRVIRLGVAACVAVAIVSFFLPWVRLSPPPSKTGTYKKPRESAIDKHTGRIRSFSGAVDEIFSGLTHGTREVASKLTGIPPRLSGYRIPILANSRMAKTVMELVESVTKKKEDVGKKSWAVYALPLAAVFLGVMLAGLCRRRLVSALVMAMSFATACGGAWELLTLNLTSDFVKVTFDYGLWLALAMFAGLGLLALFALLPAGAQERIIRLISVRRSFAPTQAQGADRAQDAKLADS